MKRNFLPILSIYIGLASCNSAEINKQYPPIVMGDSTTIVTETDSQYLKNNFVDINYKPTHPATTDTSVKTDNAIVDSPTTGNNTTSTVAASNLSGYELKIGDISLYLNKVGDKIKKGNGNNYIVPIQQFPSTITLSNAADVVSIQQRISTRLYAISKYGAMEITNLGTHTSEWKTMQVNKDNAAIIYSVPAVQPLQFKTVTAKELKNGIEQSIAKASMKQKDKELWRTALKNVSDVKDKNIETRAYKIDWKVNTKSQSHTITFTF